MSAADITREWASRCGVLLTRLGIRERGYVSRAMRTRDLCASQALMDFLYGVAVATEQIKVFDLADEGLDVIFEHEHCNLDDPDTCERIAESRGLERVWCDECDGTGEASVLGYTKHRDGSIEHNVRFSERCTLCDGTGYLHDGGECGHYAPLVPTPWDPALLICERCAIVCERCEAELCRVVVFEPGGGERRLCVHCFSAETESESPPNQNWN